MALRARDGRASGDRQVNSLGDVGGDLFDSRLDAVDAVFEAVDSALFNNRHDVLRAFSRKNES
jgi:hypothetical protein